MYDGFTLQDTLQEESVPMKVLATLALLVFPVMLSADVVHSSNQVILRKPAREVVMHKEGFLWIDAEDFEDYGGWLLDTQFVHLMGSAYLIAGGVGKSVADATTEVEIETAGTFRVWVRSRNWLKDHSPGRFSLIIDGVESKRVFGQADSEEWLWR